MTEPLINLDVWGTMKAMTDPAFLTELIDVYLIDSPQLIDQMRAGLATNEVETVRRAAHSLKSNSASFGAQRLASAARELEMIAKGGTLEGGTSKLETIEAEFDQLFPVLVELKNES